MPHSVNLPSALANDSAPSIFLPITLRSGTTYRHLGFHLFQSFEKHWMCSMIATTNTSSRLRDRNLSNFCSRYSLPSIVIREWVLEYLSNPEHSMIASYCILNESQCDETGLSNIIAFTSSFINSSLSHSQQVNSLSSFIEDELIATSKRRIVTKSLSDVEDRHVVTKRKRRR